MKYQIGEFSLLSRLPVKTLRYYHEEGILEPADIDPDSGYRLYDDTSLARARIIRELRGLDFSITEIKEILKDCKDDTQLKSFISSKLAEIAQRMASFRKIEKRLRVVLAKEDYMPEYTDNVEIKQEKDILIASIRFKGRYDEIGQYLGKLYRKAGRHVGGPCFALYWDAEYRENDADIEACLPLNKEVRGLDCRSLKSAIVASVIHKGSYETLGESYKVVTDYVKAENLPIELPLREIHHKGPGMIFRGNPKKYITEIQIPVRT